ncbi:hypothetical protein [Prochlorothrix hollandica]|uniref:hypothetical protein n=1 Tax=Prochlorothrix hollandica TaxID=1223 RepID=UPI00333FAC76
MAYSDFKTIDDVVQRLGVQVTSGNSLFATVCPIAPRPNFQEVLQDLVPLALNINTEKARSELIIAPLLLELRHHLSHKIGFFSGVEFTVDSQQGLAGFCDFLLSNSPDQVFPRAPVVCVVEAKNENIKMGYGQCIAEMVAAQVFNNRQGHAIPWILGIVTTGSNWKFLRYENQIATIDFDEYFITQVDHILGILIDTFHNITPP